MMAIIVRNSIVRFRAAMAENILQRELDPQVFHHVLEYMSEAALFLDLEGRFVFINPSAQKILHAASGEKFWDVLRDDYLGFSMREALKFGISHKRLYRSYPDKDLEITTTFLYEGDKSSHGLLVFIRDITEKQRLAALVNRGDHMQKMGEMTATITHEIRNPLGGIRGYAALLYRDLENNKNLQEMAGLILDGTKALERLVGSVLQYARPVKLLLQSTEIGGFLRQTMQFIKVDPACPPNVHWAMHIPDGPLFAPIDPAALKAVLLNLIFNAFQAMPRGGLLTCSLLKEGGCYKIAISDTGIGMDEDQLGKLFAPFFTTKEMGNGLGLVEAQKIIKAHFGTIDVRSALNKGSTFTLTLPLKR